MATDELTAFLAREPDVRSLEVMLVDLNGILRGKRVPRDEFEALFTQRVRLDAAGEHPRGSV
jgi:glutamine synthetase